jgi:hypothetical protein
VADVVGAQLAVGQVPDLRVQRQQHEISAKRR